MGARAGFRSSSAIAERTQLNAAVFLGGSIPALGPQLSKLVLPALKDMQLAGWLGKPIVLGKDCN